MTLERETAWRRCRNTHLIVQVPFNCCVVLLSRRYGALLNSMSRSKLQPDHVRDRYPDHRSAGDPGHATHTFPKAPSLTFATELFASTTSTPTTPTTMRWSQSLSLPALLLGIASLVGAINHEGAYRTLVVLEDAADKAKYSKYIADLEGRRPGGNGIAAGGVLDTINADVNCLRLQREDSLSPLNRPRTRKWPCSTWARGHTTMF